MEPMIGEIRMFAGNFAPRGWELCRGQLLSISSNTALFSILGTTYGGDGRTSFALPDLRGRVPVGEGNGPGLPNTRLGQRGGTYEVTLATSQIPSHSHTMTGGTLNAQASLHAFSETGNTNIPEGNRLANSGTFDNEFLDSGSDVTMGAGSVQVTGSIDGMQALPTGGSQAHTNMQPYLSINFIIALVGTYPSRS